MTHAIELEMWQDRRELFVPISPRRVEAFNLAALRVVELKRGEVTVEKVGDAPSGDVVMRVAPSDPEAGVDWAEALRALERPPLPEDSLNES